MNKAAIWDLDGTLFDSYPVIVESIYLTFQEAGIPLTRAEIKEYAIRYSSNALFYEVADERGLAAEALFEKYREFSRARVKDIAIIGGALEILELLKKNGFSHYVLTHRGKTTLSVLEQLGIKLYFDEILTSESGFARKPDPDALEYLIRTHKLDPQRTYYVGDRQLDMACAKNAGISGILLRRPGDIDVADGTEDYIVSDLMQIADIVL